MLFTPINLVAVINSDYKDPLLVNHDLLLCSCLNDISWISVTKWETYIIDTNSIQSVTIDQTRYIYPTLLPYFSRVHELHRSLSFNRNRDLFESGSIQELLRGITVCKCPADISTELLISSESFGDVISGNDTIDDNNYFLANTVIVFYMLSYFSSKNSLNPYTSLRCRRIVKHYYDFKLLCFLQLERPGDNHLFGNLSFSRSIHILSYTMACIQYMKYMGDTDSINYFRIYRELEFASQDLPYHQGNSPQDKLEAYFCFLLESLPSKFFPDDLMLGYLNSHPHAKAIYNNQAQKFKHSGEDINIMKRVFRSRARLLYLDDETNLKYLLSHNTDLRHYWEHSDINLIGKQLKELEKDINFLL